MTTIHFFSRIIGLAIFCLSFITTSIAQVQQLGNTTTSNEYETAATSASGNYAVTAFQKPDLSIRLAPYLVSSTGATITLKEDIDLGKASKVNVAMLSSTRVALVVRGTDGNLKVTIFDLNTSTGKFTQRGSFTGPAALNIKPGIVRLSSSSFAIGTASSSGGMRLTTFTVSSTGTLTKKDDETGGTIEAIDLAPISDVRFVAGVRLANDQMKVICFDVASSNQNITRRGDHQWGSAVKQMSMVKVSTTRFIAFKTDTDFNLDATSFNLTSSGNFIILDDKNDLKNPSNNQVIRLKELDGQYMGNSKILLSTIGLNSNPKHTIYPVKTDSAGKILMQTGASTPSGEFNLTYSAVVDGKLITASRQMNNKYKLVTFKW